MEPVKQTYVAITDYDFRTSMGTPVADEEDAVKKTLAARGIMFRTYEVSSVNLGGKELKGEPENYSPTHYVGIERVYTRDEVLDYMRDDMKRADKFMREAIKPVMEHYAQMPADSIHITGLERPGEFIEIGKDQKVFNRSGRQIWPKEEPKIAIDHAVRPVKKLQLKPQP